MDLKPCPRKQCRGPAEPVEYDMDFATGIGVRIRCTVCNVLGPWGGAKGLNGLVQAAKFWNEEWGRDE